MMGRRQVVRHQVLILICGGSNPPGPEGLEKGRSLVSTYAIVLAAGKGTRMNSDLPKVLHLLHDRPMIFYVLDAAFQSGIKNFVVVVGHKRELVKEKVLQWQEENPLAVIKFALQEQQNGTGHAVQVAQSFLPQQNAKILVLLGDVPLLKFQTLQTVVSELKENAAVVVSMNLENPAGYGRIVRSANENKVEEIIEEKDANEKQKQINEVNTGIFLFQAEKLWQYLPLLKNENSQNELYLTDMVKILKTHQQQVTAQLFADAHQFEGVNSVEQLSRLETMMQEGLID